MEHVCRIEKKGEKQFVVHFKNSEGEHSMECNMVLFGTGRKPNTDRLNLQVNGPRAASPVVSVSDLRM